ncbi:LuxR C-terminal-related transcriptional regulator [Streptomyces sp. MUM 16J]|uniref:helix-turn-helix transcriptional regulator n=1 Tax=Streptomyces sp. MUM 16J TaxID=2791988 RepID=UPI0005834D4E|nr:LuxR C-terminal-related transcriptional regulator [Streptomyces sp. MUM 16J]MCH0559383.1 response regulator transcription factor [Streptomyces sp. MUM 16J]
MLNSIRTTHAGTADGTTVSAARVPVTVYAGDPISREGAMAQLRRYPDMELRDASAAGSGTVTLFISDTLDETTLTRLRKVVRNQGARAVLVVGALREDELLDVIECGIGAIVWRHEATAARLEQAVRAAARGDGDLPADLLGRLISQVSSLHRDSAGRPGVAAPGLTPREVDVLRLVADGFDTAEIARKMTYSERTVKNVIHGLTARLHLRNRAHAVAHAVRAGYI